MDRGSFCKALSRSRWTCKLCGVGLSTCAEICCHFGTGRAPLGHCSGTGVTFVMYFPVGGGPSQTFVSGLQRGSMARPRFHMACLAMQGVGGFYSTLRCSGVCADAACRRGRWRLAHREPPVGQGPPPRVIGFAVVGPICQIWVCMPHPTYDSQAAF